MPLHERLPFPEELTTERLVLSRIREDDLPDYLAFYANEQTTATLGGPRSEARVRKWLDWQLQHWQQHAFGWWTMRLRESGPLAPRVDNGLSRSESPTLGGPFIGRGGIQRAVVEDRDEVELGYGLLPQYWGQGLAAEMSREALRLGFDVLGLDSVVAFTLPANRPSQRVMEKAGLRYEREILWADLPHVLYRIARP